MERSTGKTGTLRGQVLLRDLPPVRKLLARLTLLRVPDAGASLPEAGVPETDLETLELQGLHNPDEAPLEFEVERAAGFYFLEISLIAVREAGGALYAQSEQFILGERPAEVRSGAVTALVLEIPWPDVPLADLEYRATLYPRDAPRPPA